MRGSRYQRQIAGAGASVQGAVVGLAGEVQVLQPAGDRGGDVGQVRGDPLVVAGQQRIGHRLVELDGLLLAQQRLDQLVAAAADLAGGRDDPWAPASSESRVAAISSLNRPFRRSAISSRGCW